MRIERLGGLKARLTGGTDGRGGGVGPVVVLLHGFGAPGDDMVPIGQVLEAPRGTRYVFPEAPLAFDLGFLESRAWWMIDMEQLALDIARGNLREIASRVPQGLAGARARVVALLDDVERRLGAKPDRIVLGGFSQGAMLACDVAFRTDRTLAGLVILSGSLIAQEEWIRLMPKRNGLPVLQSHGNGDPLLPFVLAERLRDFLTQAGLPVEWVPFAGGHEIAPPVIRKLGAFLNEVVGK